MDCSIAHVLCFLAPRDRLATSGRTVAPTSQLNCTCVASPLPRCAPHHLVAQTWAGTIACFCGTLAGSAAFLRLFMSTGHLPPLGPEPGAVPWLPLLVTSVVAALVESLPVQVDAGVLVGWLVSSAVLKTKHAGSRPQHQHIV